jgi:hypothetical protein
LLATLHDHGQSRFVNAWQRLRRGTGSQQLQRRNRGFVQAVCWRESGNQIDQRCLAHFKERSAGGRP